MDKKSENSGISPGIIFSRSGYKSRLYRVNPLLFPQFGLSNECFLPDDRNLPKHGLVTRFYPFDFGFSSYGNAIAPYDTAYCPLIVGRDFLVTAITAVYQAAPPQTIQNPPAAPAIIGQPNANVSPGFLVSWLHTHAGVTRQWSNKNVTDSEFTGNGRYPLLLKDPALLPQGDTITCVIQNLANVTLLGQVVFMGGEFDTALYGEEPGA